MKLVVGLGNPGDSYTFTRHNAGFLVIDNYCKQRGDGIFSYNKNFDAQITSIIHNKTKNIILAKPQTYMNLSGKSVKAISHFYKIKPENILILHDEIDLHVGEIKYKDGGGHAGHNGIKSIINELGTNEFKRVRIGIGRPNNESVSISDYVLGVFQKNQWEEIEKKYEEINKIITQFVD